MKIPALFLAAIAAGCAAPPVEQPAPPDPTIVRQEIEAANARQIAAILKSDATAGSANYADDAIFMMAGSPAVSGKASITELFTGMVQSSTFSDVTMQTNDVVVSGDLAVETGSFKWTVTPKGGKPMPEAGKYLTIWQKQADGSWKIIRDINNSDVPPKM